MGQQTGCCEKKPDIRDQILLEANRAIQPTEESNQFKKSYNPKLLSKDNKEDLVEGEMIKAEPKLPEQVSSRLIKIGQLQIPENKVERGVFKTDIIRFHKTGIIYVGQWKKKIPQGIGKNYYPNGGYYEGTFEDGIPHGYGRFVNANGDFYEGSIRYGRANGHGVYQNENSVYRGEFKDNHKHGEGTEKGKNFYFKGRYEFDEKAEGTLNYQNNIYEGEFLGGLYHGKGKLTTSNGFYVGEFKEGQQDGFGQFRWQDGSTYRGNYHEGVREGDGQYFNIKSKTISKGQWKSGVLNGVGEYLDPYGTKYKCIWSNGRIAGLVD